MKINKSMEIAKFALAQGRYVTARDRWDLGFRYSRGETTPDNISAVVERHSAGTLEFTVRGVTGRYDNNGHWREKSRD